jgi:hypothetical protein
MNSQGRDNNMKTFEDYLKEEFGKNYRGLDDDMPDAYDAWVSELDITTVMQLADMVIERLVNKHE